jgi:hypothetical protein
VKERHVLKGFYHDTLGEKDRKLGLEKVHTFITRRFDEPHNRPSLIEADKSGFTCEEAVTLSSSLSPLSVRGLYWAMTRAALKLGGVLSAGIKLGHKTGFDSGSTLDYVYRNEAKGITPIGKYIDKAYLNSIGWRGIRQRKVNTEEMIRLASDKLRKKGKPVHIVDVASGHGRYILEAIEQSQTKPDSILLRDYSDLNVEQGSQLIQEKGLNKIATFVKANAFDTASYQTFATKPTLGVVSGLYELFPNNDLIRQSLQGFAQAIETGGYLVYTGQPWHPQLEMIARALTSHRDGQAWVMRRRTQEEMDQLVENAGFTKIEQRIDEYGIFTVSLARKD